MNKLLIPTILAATVLIAGVFALMPVQEASTVHTTIQNSQLQIKTTSDTAVTVTAAQVVTIDLNAPFELVSVAFECTSIIPTGGDDDTTCQDEESMDVATFTIDGSTPGNTVTLGLLAGLNTAEVRVLFLDGDTAGAANDLAGLNLKAADRIAFTMANDITDSTAADNDFDMTVRIVVITQGDTAVTAAQIDFT